MQTEIGRGWRWLVLVGMLLLGALGQQARASEANPADRLVRAPVVLEKAPSATAPQLAHAYRARAPTPSGFHFGQGFGIGLSALSAGAIGIGVSMLFTESHIGPYIGIGAIHLGGAVAMLGSGAALAAAAALRRDGHTVSMVPGVLSLVVGAIGLASIAALPLDPLPTVIGAVMAPVALGLTIGQLTVNHRAVTSSVAVVPLERGAMPVLTLRF